MNMDAGRVNVLMLSRYGRLGASSRMRFYQYTHALEEAGITIRAAPLFGDQYVQGLQSGNKSVRHAVCSYVRRVRALARSRNFDLLWIEKDLLPWLPEAVEQAFVPRSVPYVLDYDDAVFHYYDQHRNAVIKALLEGKHAALMCSASAVVAGNEYIAEYSRQAGARHVIVLPTVIDLERYPPPAARDRRTGAPPCVGWVGQRATAAFLSPLTSVLQCLSASGAARMVAIGIDASALGLPMESIAWTEASEVESIAAFDIGIMPLADAPFERGKCGYKLIQYMACGLPVVASPVGVNAQIVEHGVNGFLAESTAEWEQALRMLLQDEGLRRRMGQAGRRKVEKQYSLQVTGPVLARVLLEAAGK